MRHYRYRAAFTAAVVSVVALCALFLSCRRLDASEVRTIAGLIKAGALVVDVRTPREFAAGHFPGAINIPLQELSARTAELGDRTRPVIVYCRTGNRSGQAKVILERLGFTRVYNGGGLRDMEAVRAVLSE